MGDGMDIAVIDDIHTCKHMNCNFISCSKMILIQVQVSCLLPLEILFTTFCIPNLFYSLHCDFLFSLPCLFISSDNLAWSFINVYTWQSNKCSSFPLSFFELSTANSNCNFGKKISKFVPSFRRLKLQCKLWWWSRI